MNNVKRIPYGISEFNRIRRDNFYFVDKSMYLPQIEEMPSYLFLIRPRRFGKSVFLSMMRTYYDILQRDNFDKYFGDLWIGSHPTPKRNSYQILYFDFSKANLGTGSLEENFNNYCNSQLTDFMRQYASFYENEGIEKLLESTQASTKLQWLEVVARRLGYSLYLIIDEYDSLTNIILNEQGQKMCHDVTRVIGFYREYFKQFKGMFDRIFLMGVSPVKFGNLFTGYYMDWNISSDEVFNAMIGFDEAEVRDIFTYYQQSGMLVGDIEAMIKEMKPWYNNYCFAEESLKGKRVFNCDMVLYYLHHQLDFHCAPDEMTGLNIHPDCNKLKMLACIDKDIVQKDLRISIIEEIIAKGEILVDLQTSFPVEEVTHINNFCSLLYYYGLLTMCGTRGNRIRMCIPNNYICEQYNKFLQESMVRCEEINNIKEY